MYARPSRCRPRRRPPGSSGRGASPCRRPASRTRGSVSLPGRHVAGGVEDGVLGEGVRPLVGVAAVHRVVVAVHEFAGSRRDLQCWKACWRRYPRSGGRRTADRGARRPAMSRERGAPPPGPRCLLISPADGRRSHRSSEWPRGPDVAHVLLATAAAALPRLGQRRRAAAAAGPRQPRPRPQLGLGGGAAPRTSTTSSPPTSAATATRSGAPGRATRWPSTSTTSRS